MRIATGTVLTLLIRNSILSSIIYLNLWHWGLDSGGGEYSQEDHNYMLPARRKSSASYMLAWSRDE